MLVGDLTLILLNSESIEPALNLLDEFSKCSGLKINRDKTQVKLVGKSQTADHYPRGLSWIKQPLETLGVFITTNQLRH